MGFLGMLAGFVLGALSGRWEAALAGAVLGLLAGMLLRHGRGSSTASSGSGDERLRSLEAKVDWLYRQQQQMLARLEALETGSQSLEPRPAGAEPQTLAADGSGASAPLEAIPPSESAARLTNEPAQPSTRLAVNAAQAPGGETEPQSPETEEREAVQAGLWPRLLAGNPLAKVGVVLLFFGVASALKLAVEHGLFPVQVRLLLGSVMAVAMILFGWTRREIPERRTFGIALQGGGFAILYLIVFFMLARYHLIGNAAAFALFAALGLACVLLAVRQEGVALAVLGIAGAFLAPVLAASTSGSHLALFSYFALLNAFIIVVDWHKSWRPLNITGFLFTFVIGMSWALMRYRPEFYAETQCFLILFFLMYSATPVLFALLRAPGFRGWSDALLAFGTPLAAAALQVPLVREYEYGLAWSAFGASLYYLMLWLALSRGRQEETRLLERSQLGIGVAFLTVAVPLAFGVQVTCAFWAVEGAAMLWFGLRQSRLPPQAFGLLVQAGAGAYFLARFGELQRIAPVWNDVFVGGLLIAAAGLISARLLHVAGRSERRGEPAAAPLVLGWGLAWWFGTGLSEIGQFAGHAARVPFGLLFAAGSAAAMEGFGRAGSWGELRRATLPLLPFAIGCAVLARQAQAHALAGFMIVALPIALLVHYWTLARHEHDGLECLDLLRHLGAYWLLAALAGHELSWLAGQLAPGVTLGPLLAWGASAAVTLYAIGAGSANSVWPFAARPSDYIEAGGLPIALVIVIWSPVANLSHSGAGFALPYVPLLNPFDATQILALASLRAWARIGVKAGPSAPRRLCGGAVYGLGFLWVSALAARIAHHWGGVPFAFDALVRSLLLQSMLSLTWTALAIGLMILAARRLRREVWFAGFALLGLVGMKLLFVDLANAGTVSWTASLIGVALLVLAAGYFAPAPPKAVDPRAALRP